MVTKIAGVQMKINVSLLNVQQQHTKIKHENPCRSRELNPGPLAPKAVALPVHHWVNSVPIEVKQCVET